MTDIRAYEEVGQPKDRTFIVGKFGGKNGTGACCCAGGAIQF